MNYSRFRHLAIERAKPAPTADQLTAIEVLLEASLPLSFREFLQVANGGYIEYFVDVAFSDGTSQPMSFCEVFSTNDGNCGYGTFIAEILSARECQKIPSGVLPFASNGNSTVFLDLTEEGRGRVVAFVKGLPEWTGLRTESTFVELASSFDEYVSKLRIDRATVIDQLCLDAKTSGHVDATEEWLDIGMPSWRDDTELAAAMRDARSRVTTNSL